MIKLRRTLSIIYIVLALGFTGMLFYWSASSDGGELFSDIKLTQTGDYETAKINFANMIPGDSVTQEFSISSKNDKGSYIISFKVGNPSDLLTFLKIVVAVNGSEIFSGKLDALTLTDSQLPRLEIGKQTENIHISYNLPLGTGNEAQGKKLELIVLIAYQEG